MSITRINPPDTGWIELPLSSGAQAYQQGVEPRYRKIGNVLYLDGWAKPKSAVAAWGTLEIGVLPTGFRPTRAAYIIQQGSSASIWMLAVYSDGVVSVERYRDGATAMAMSTSTWLPMLASIPLG